MDPHLAERLRRQSAATQAAMDGNEEWCLLVLRITGCFKHVLAERRGNLVMDTLVPLHAPLVVVVVVVLMFVLVTAMLILVHVRNSQGGPQRQQRHACRVHTSRVGVGRGKAQRDRTG